MFKTVTAALEGSRTAPLVEPEGEIILEGFDLTGAAFRMEVRDRRDGGMLRAALDTVTSATAEGVRIVSVETVDGIPITTLGIRINETTMESMPAAPEPGDNNEIAWGMHITPDDGAKFEAFDGPFIVKASAVE